MRGRENLRLYASTLTENVFSRHRSASTLCPRRKYGTICQHDRQKEIFLPPPDQIVDMVGPLRRGTHVF
jgi:hypothetical protein